MLLSEASLAHAVAGLGAARRRGAVRGTVQEGVVEADVVGAAYEAPLCPVDNTGMSRVVSEKARLRA